MKLTLLPLSDDGMVCLQCEGTVTLRYVPVSVDPLQELLGPYCWAHKVLMDMSQVTGIETSGISWLLQSNNSFSRSRGVLVLHSVPFVVTAFLDFLQMSGQIRVAANEAEAKELALGGPGSGGSHGSDDNADLPIRALDLKRPPRAV